MNSPLQGDPCAEIPEVKGAEELGVPHSRNTTCSEQRRSHKARASGDGGKKRVLGPKSERITRCAVQSRAKERLPQTWWGEKVGYTELKSRDRQ